VTRFTKRKTINTVFGRPSDFMPGDAASGGGIARVRLAFLTVFLSLFLFFTIYQFSCGKTRDEFCFCPLQLQWFILYNNIQYSDPPTRYKHRQRDHPSELLYN